MEVGALVDKVNWFRSSNLVSIMVTYQVQSPPEEYQISFAKGTKRKRLAKVNESQPFLIIIYISNIYIRHVIPAIKANVAAMALVSHQLLLLFISSSLIFFIYKPHVVIGIPSSYFLLASFPFFPYLGFIPVLSLQSLAPTQMLQVVLSPHLTLQNKQIHHQKSHIQFMSLDWVRTCLNFPNPPGSVIELSQIHPTHLNLLIPSFQEWILLSLESLSIVSYLHFTIPSS